MIPPSKTAQVLRLDGEARWQVTLPQKPRGGARWYTVKCLPHLPEGWLIVNAKGVEVKPTGKLGREIIAAVETCL